MAGSNSGDLFDQRKSATIEPERLTSPVKLQSFLNNDTFKAYI